MILKSSHQLQKYQEVAKLSTSILWQLHQKVEAGVTPLEVDALAESLCLQHGVRPNFKGVGSPDNPYKYSTCISVNDTVVHGIPQDVPLKKGDLVKVDFGIEKDDYNTDHCFTVVVGDFISKQDENLLKTGKEAVLKAAHMAKVGKTTGDLGYAMESTVEAQGFTVAKEYVGHGIGRTLHDEPHIPAWGIPGRGQKLKEGMVICVEAQVIAGDNNLYTDKDGWSVKTKDGSRVVMFEYMVVVGKKSANILTPTMDWPLVR
ncbi:MAG: type I methionyl aminopeptidase [Candidatus Pacebacteria bacterium]|jgi:methionyl aminopeptidase|nr:type I methionyl aminopeptidase [Candidatus Paceibacterota bacterium]MBT4652146.1 type I methionyl aminopeptidase [Candidatus Paceibacterota bacterium]MBT6756684.1 type I methionyl aminopeptidase [Candidatus Paceibacterota bacterium]MBT6920771.1 type I methionyl aminopeptidase [Candidatus Paceibacterota bacterium]